MSDSPFIPRNYPKSGVIFICAVLLGLVVGGVAFVGHWLGIEAIVNVSRVLFFACAGVSLVMGLIFIPNTWAGKYRNLPSKPWREQVW